MRIVIEPTNETARHESANCVQHKVIVEHPYDDLNLGDVVQLVSRALVAFGFSSKRVAEHFEEVANG